MNPIQVGAAVLVGLILFANLLHPGGWLVALIAIAIIAVVYAALEFMPEYILVTNQGKNARKDKRRRRRARGLNPFSRTSQRDTQTSQSNSQSGGGNDE